MGKTGNKIRYKGVYRLYRNGILEQETPYNLLNAFGVVPAITVDELALMTTQEIESRAAAMIDFIPDKCASFQIINGVIVFDGCVIPVVSAEFTWSNKVCQLTKTALEWLPSTMPSSERWQSVSYGGGKFVAVGGNIGGSSNAAYSVDGINWTQATLPVAAYWQSVAYGGGKFVAIAENGKVSAYSTNGINWTQGTLPSSELWISVVYGGGKFVAIAAYTNIVAYSADGVNWSQGAMPGNRENWSSVVYGGGKFVAIAGNTNNKTAYSTNGINWTQGTMPEAFWRSIAYGGGKFVAISTAASNEVAYSADGVNWSKASLPSSRSWEGITYGSGMFVVTSYNNISAYSTDGVNWVQMTMPSGSSQFTGVVYGGDKFVAVSWSNKAAYLMAERSINTGNALATTLILVNGDVTEIFSILGRFGNYAAISESDYIAMPDSDVEERGVALIAYVVATKDIESYTVTNHVIEMNIEMCPPQ